jgi:organic radical activating enzyme
MKTVSALLDSGWRERYRRISSLNIRSSIYDLTCRCNLRCKGCFFFSSGEHHVLEEMDIRKWEAFIDREKARGVNLAILIGGEPTLCMDRLEAFYRRIPTYCATNGLIKVPRDRFPDMMMSISLWGGSEVEKILRGRDTFAVSSKNYEGDPCAYYLYTLTPRQVGKTGPVIRRIRDVGLKVHLQLLSNDEGMEGFSWRAEELRDLRFELDEMLDHRSDAGAAFRLGGMPVRDRIPRPSAAAGASAHSFLPLGGRPADRPPLLHVRHARLLHLQGRRSAHELGHGQQARPHEHDEGSAELDRSL